MKISLVATVKDAAPHIAEFLASVRAQTRAPDEIVIVDGGSTDGTRQLLEAAPEVTLLEETGANIARGRNIAVRAAAHDIVAVADADCVLAPDWLAHLERAMDAGADVAGGFYRPLAGTLFEACAAAVSVKEADEVDPDRWMPSARSVAFRRDAFEAAGAYPEWLDIGEDMYLNHRWREAGLRMDFVPEAIAYWRIRSSVPETWTQYFRYAEGDGVARMHPERQAARFAAYGGAVAILRSRSGLAKGLLLLAGGLYAGRRVRRAWRLLPDRPRDRAASTLLVPALTVLMDVAKMAGWISGRARRRPR